MIRRFLWLFTLLFLAAGRKEVRVTLVIAVLLGTPIVAIVIGLALGQEPGAPCVGTLVKIVCAGLKGPM
jgi:hypothetical protein